MKQFSFTTWNIMGKRPLKSRLLRRISDYLHTQQADIVCLQENPHGKSIVGESTPYAEYNVAQTQKAKSIFFNANTILSKFPIVHSGEISFSRHKDNARQRIFNIRDRHECVWADIDIGKSIVRVYNCHLKLIATTAKDRLRAIERVYHHAREVTGSVIVCGDMNTVLSHPKGLVRRFIKWFNAIEETYLPGDFHLRDERNEFRKSATRHQFTDILPLQKPTFALPHTSIELFDLKLDWVLTRNLQHKNYSFGSYISDHRPVHAQFEIGSQD